MAVRGLVSAIAAGATAALVGAGSMSAVAAPLPRSADSSPSATAVDVEVVLAVDVSYSMDPDEQALQREGYISAITSREFMQALRSGMQGRISITYFEWAGLYDQKIILPWRVIDGPASAEAVANEIACASWT